MGYILNLRKYIGHKPIIMTSDCVLILNEKNQLLLQKRKDNNLWSYPGGSLEIGESFEECAIREVFEETGLECKSLKYFTTASGKDMHYTYPNGDEVYIAETVYICRKYTGILKVQKDEVTEQKFFELKKLPVNIHPVNINVIKKLVDFLQNLNT